MENPDSIQNSGAYRFAFDQGQQAIERSAAAKGMLNSGNILAELADMVRAWLRSVTTRNPTVWQFALGND